MVDFAPYLAEKLRLWDRHVDDQGRTTLNMPEYMEFRKKMAEKAVKVSKKKQTQAKNKNKIK
jgi:predicted metal-binding transcription factor (methanogenesis marker protein 9)